MRFADILPGIRNPAARQLNVSVEKTFWLNDRFTLQFRGEGYNLTNTPILPAPDTTLGDPTFGKLPIQQNNCPRFVQLAAKIVFRACASPIGVFSILDRVDADLFTRFDKPNAIVADKKALFGILVFEHLHGTAATFGHAMNRRQNIHRDLLWDGTDVVLGVV